MDSRAYSDLLSDISGSPEVHIPSFLDLIYGSLRPLPVWSDPTSKSLPDLIESIVSPTLSIQRPVSVNPGNIFSSYLNVVQHALDPPAYLAFVASLGQYVAGRMTHEGIVRVFASIIPPSIARTAPVWRILPVFLAAVNCGSSPDVPISIDADPDWMVWHFIVQVFAYIWKVGPRESIARCLAFLGEGLISRAVAEEWMERLGVRNLDLRLLERIPDLAAFHPLRVPRGLLPCPVTQSPGTVAQQFALREYRDRLMDDFSPVSLEVLAVPVRHLRKLLKKLIDGGTLSEGELATVYGPTARDLLGTQGLVGTIMMDRLSQCYGRAHARYDKALKRVLAGFSVGDPQFRFAYKLWLRVPTFCGPFLYPGTRSMDCHSPAAVKCALAFLGEFIQFYFVGAKKDMLAASLSILAEIFGEAEDGYFIVDDPQLKAALYLAEISRLLGQSGDPRGVELGDGRVGSFLDPQKTEFGQKIRLLPQKLVQGENPFTGLPLGVVDLPLVRCLRFLALFEGGAVVRFPDTVEDYSLFSTLHQVRKGRRLVLTCTTNFSPTADDDD
jgi:hypothetical protein